MPPKMPIQLVFFGLCLVNVSFKKHASHTQTRGSRLINMLSVSVYIVWRIFIQKLSISRWSVDHIFCFLFWFFFIVIVCLRKCKFQAGLDIKWMVSKWATDIEPQRVRTFVITSCLFNSFKFQKNKRQISVDSQTKRDAFGDISDR